MTKNYFLCQSAHITLLQMVINYACSYSPTTHAHIFHTNGVEYEHVFKIMFFLFNNVIIFKLSYLIL